MESSPDRPQRPLHGKCVELDQNATETCLDI